MNRGENISVTYRKDRKERRKRMEIKRLFLVIFSYFQQKALLQTGNPTQETLNRYVENRRIQANTVFIP